MFPSNFSKTWTLQQATTVLAWAKMFSCKGHCKRAGLGNVRVGFFAPSLFQLEITVVKCRWTSTLKCPREDMHPYISELSPSLAKKSSASPLLVFSPSEWDLPLDVLIVPGVSESTWKCQGKRKTKKVLHLFGHYYLWKLGYKLTLLIHNVFRHSVYRNMQSLEGYPRIVSLEKWWGFTCWVTSSSFQPHSCQALSFWMKPEWVANNWQEITRCFPASGRIYFRWVYPEIWTRVQICSYFVWSLPAWDTWRIQIPTYICQNKANIRSNTNNLK